MNTLKRWMCSLNEIHFQSNCFHACQAPVDIAWRFHWQIKDSSKAVDNCLACLKPPHSIESASINVAHQILLRPSHSFEYEWHAPCMLIYYAYRLWCISDVAWKPYFTWMTLVGRFSDLALKPPQRAHGETATSYITITVDAYARAHFNSQNWKL